MVERGWDAGWGDFIGIMLIGIVILVVVANNDTLEMRPAPKIDDYPNSAESLSQRLNFNNERS